MPRKNYRLRGRFVSKEEYLAAQKLNKAAKQEKKRQWHPSKARAKDYKTKRFVKETRESQALQKVVGRGSKERTERLYSVLDKGSIPSPDIERTYKDFRYADSSLKRFEWRFNGLEGELQARELLRNLGKWLNDNEDKQVKTWLTLSYRLRNEYHAIGTSSQKHPRDTIQKLNDLLELKSESAQEVFENVDDNGKLFFDVVALTRDEIPFTKYDKPRGSNKPVRKNKGSRTEGKQKRTLGKGAKGTVRKQSRGARKVSKSASRVKAKTPKTRKRR